MGLLRWGQSKTEEELKMTNVKLTKEEKVKMLKALLDDCETAIEKEFTLLSLYLDCKVNGKTMEEWIQKEFGLNADELIGEDELTEEQKEWEKEINWIER